MLNNRLDIVIIGLGSRGLSILERCLKKIEQPESKQWHFYLHLVEPSMLGVGIHKTQQPDYLLLNTICSQISMFPDQSALGNAHSREGLNLYQWVQQQGYKLHQDGYTVSPEGECKIEPTAHLPRRILGEYLNWFYQKITQELPSNVTIRHYLQEAVNLMGEREREVVILNNGVKIKADFVFITVGHVANPIFNSLKTLTPYPLPQNLQNVKPRETVAIMGFGLSSMDVVAALTVGRGGKYQNGQYIPSGLEPELILYSRSGLPFRSRPLFDREYTFEPVVFSLKTVEAMRNAGSALNYQKQIKPLILLEMCCRYYLQSEYLQYSRDTAIALHQQLCLAYQHNCLPQQLAKLAAIYGIFEPQKVLDPNLEPYLQDARSYQARIIQFIQEDLEQANRGIHNSPLKTALETFRDLRNVIRYAVDWGGLTDISHQDFMQHETVLMNRTVIGPQKERHQELLALIKANILKIPLGPLPKIDFNGQSYKLSSTQLKNPTTIYADWLIKGHSDTPTLENTDSELIINLVKSGRLTPFKSHCPSVNINRNYQPLDQQGQPQTRIWLLGPLLEGTTFYNHYVPSPYNASRAFVEAHQCVRHLFEFLDHHEFLRTTPCYETL